MPRSKYSREELVKLLCNKIKANASEEEIIDLLEYQEFNNRQIDLILDEVNEHLEKEGFFQENDEDPLKKEDYSWQGLLESTNLNVKNEQISLNQKQESTNFDLEKYLFTKDEDLANLTTNANVNNPSSVTFLIERSFSLLFANFSKYLILFLLHFFVPFLILSYFAMTKSSNILVLIPPFMALFVMSVSEFNNSQGDYLKAIKTSLSKLIPISLTALISFMIFNGLMLILFLIAYYFGFINKTFSLSTNYLILLVIYWALMSGPLFVAAKKNIFFFQAISYSIVLIRERIIDFSIRIFASSFVVMVMIFFFTVICFLFGINDETKNFSFVKIENLSQFMVLFSSYFYFLMIKFLTQPSLIPLTCIFLFLILAWFLLFLQLSYEDLIDSFKEIFSLSSITYLLLFVCAIGGCVMLLLSVYSNI